MTEKNQAEQDIDLLKIVFKGNELLLKIVRSLFFGIELTKKEKGLIRENFQNSDIREALRRKTYPIFSKEVPIGAEADFWEGIENQILGRGQDAVYQAVKSKEIALNLFNQGFALLENPDGEQIDLSYTTESLLLDPLQTKLLARNLYFKTIKTALMMVKTIVEQKEESENARKKRLELDSAK